MPDLAGKSELSESTRNRQGLAELRSTYNALSLIGEDRVRIDVKAVQIFTEKNRSRLSKSANVEFGRNARVNPPRIANRHCRSRFPTRIKKSLRACEDLAFMHRSLALKSTDRERFALQDQLHPRKDGEFSDLAYPHAP